MQLVERRRNLTVLRTSVHLP